MILLLFFSCVLVGLTTVDKLEVFYIDPNNMTDNLQVFEVRINGFHFILRFQSNRLSSYEKHPVRRKN